jgi:thiol-disulfide isomerase/thioredoxin/YHS domain-containing protein
MRRVVWASMLVCASVMPTAFAVASDMKTADATPAGSATAETPSAAWQANFEEALAEAKRRKLPLLLHFHAAWCGPCRQMDSGVLNTPEVLAACGKTCVAVKVDTDARSDLASRYGVAALPTDVFVGPDGKVLGRHVGQATRDVYLSRMDEMNRQVAAADTAVAESGSEEPKAATNELLPRLASAGGIGLDGFSPVSLSTSRVWREGSPEFAWRHAGAIYFMADAEELDLFKQDPNKYAPQHSGFDPLLLSTDQVAIRGLISYGSFYEGKLYLHATESSRATFIRDPGKYPAPEEIAIPAQIAGHRPPVVAEIPSMIGS